MRPRVAKFFHRLFQCSDLRLRPYGKKATALFASGFRFQSQLFFLLIRQFCFAFHRRGAVGVDVLNFSFVHKETGMLRFPPISVEILVQLFVINPIIVDVVPIDVTSSASLVAFIFLLSFFLFFLIVLGLLFIAPWRAFIRILIINTNLSFIFLRFLFLRGRWNHRPPGRPRRMIVFHLRPARIIVVVIVIVIVIVVLAPVLLSFAFLSIFFLLPITLFLFLALFFARTSLGGITIVPGLHPALIQRLYPSNNCCHVPPATIRFQHLIARIRVLRISHFLLLLFLLFHLLFHRYPGLFFDQFFIVDDVVRRVFQV
mmetsp:Transcript_11280/g.31896  ORF Transcript_11280/g.31896 Transcript_11280/m.31896 type:complete len:315 (-) Transcript_11280:480-1424(-)